MGPRDRPSHTLPVRMPDPAENPPGEREFEQAGLLDGLDGAARVERVALLEYLTAQGSTVEDLKRYAGSGALLFASAEQVIGGSERYSQAEVAERAEVDLEFLEELRRAMGMPRPDPAERSFSETDVEAARLAKMAITAGITREEILDVTRVLGRGLAPAAELMRAIALRLVLEPGLSERELAERFAQASAGLAPMTAPLVGNLLTIQLRQMAETEAISAVERSGGQIPGSREVAVSFADLVGFTRVGEEVPPDELGRMATRLEMLTSEAIPAPVRLVKTIGDAVMLVSPDDDALLSSALTLVEAADNEGQDFPQLRVGMARGPAVGRAGDWFGRPVNMASRITSVARPGSVLVSAEVRAAVGDDRYRWSFAGERRLKGIRAQIPLFRARLREAANDRSPGNAAPKRDGGR